MLNFFKDCFATLVAIIFIIDAFKSTWGLRKPRGSEILVTNSNSTNESNFNISTTTFSPLVQSETNAKFYFSIILFFLTFFLSSSLKEFRHKPFLPSKVIHFNSFEILRTYYKIHFLGKRNIK